MADAPLSTGVTAGPSSRPPRARRWLLGLALLLLLVGGGSVGWLWWRQPDLEKALDANQKGVGYMERYQYPEAVASFEEAVRQAPDWQPGRINLGIGLFNLARGQADKEKQEQTYKRAIAAFKDVLAHDKKNPHALFGLGLIYQEGFGRYKEAEPYFREVTEVDPNDAAAWFWLGQSLQEDDAQALKCFRRAVELDPNLSGALYGLQQKLRQTDDAKAADDLMARLTALKSADWVNPLDPKYNTDLGRYGQVIGRTAPAIATPVGPLPTFRLADNFRVKLRPGARWATARDFASDPVGELRARLRARFGGTLIVLDYNGDNRPDLFLAAAVAEDGKIGDLLLRHDADNQFTDVTVEAGLGGDSATVGAVAADFDNDGRTDLLLTGVGGVRLLRNNGKGGFEDVTRQAGLDKIDGVCLGACFIDLDQDGDLDLLVARYAGSAEKALVALKGETKATGGGIAVYLNVGEAPAASRNVDPPPLRPAFRAADLPGMPKDAGAVVAFAASDLDQDQDLDVLAVADGTAPTVVLNDRLLKFHNAALPEKLAGAAAWNGALILDVNHDERSDVLLIGPEQRPVLAVRQPTPPGAEVSKWFERGPIDAPPLLQAQAIDLDLDGWTDVVGLSRDRKPVLLHNEGQGLVERRNALGLDTDWPADLIAVACTDTDCDGYPDLLLWSEGSGLQLRTNKGNGNHGLKLRLSGHRRVEPAGFVVRCNVDGFGTRVIAQAGEFWTDAEYTTLAAGLGQSSQPLVMGLGRHREASLLRFRWPDICWQAEFNVPASSCGKDFGVLRLEESNRKETSCPILFAWDGRRFVFVTDFLGAGSVGECEPDGGHRLPRPEESVKIEPAQLAPLNGDYVLKIAEPMSEITYLDQLQLAVLDHPAGVRVYPDERFAAGGPPPTQDLIAFRDEIFPVKATDHHGRDVTAALRRWDRDTVSDFGRRAWLGFAEEHAVTLDFGDRLAKFGPRDRLVLCLAGWTDYPYPESIWAAHQAGVEMLPPVLERKTADGRWEKVADAGFPAGLPRLMTLDVTGRFGGPRCEVRLRTNLHVFWDQVFVAPVLETVGAGQGSGTVRGTVLEVKEAALAARGLMKEYSPDGREPTLYDYDRLDSFPVSRLSGRLTRYGDVTELLRTRDDRFVIFGAGDELSVRFDAGRLPPLPDGWQRSYVLRTSGYCKDASLFTAHGDTVEPLPFRAMSNYPYRDDEKHPDPEYDRKWNTRLVGPRR